MEDAHKQALTVDGFPLVIVAADSHHYLDLRSLARRMRSSFVELEGIARTRVHRAAQVREFPDLKCVGIERQAVHDALLGRRSFYGDEAHINGFRAAWPVADALLAVREGQRTGPTTAAMLKRHGFHAEARKAIERYRRDTEHAELVRKLHALLVKEGLTTREASERLGFASGALSQIARRTYPSWTPAMELAWSETFGQEPYRPKALAAARRKLTPAALLKAHACIHSEGMSQNAAAQAIGISPATLSLAIRRQYRAWSPELERAWKGSFGRR